MVAFHVKHLLMTGLCLLSLGLVAAEATPTQTSTEPEKSKSDSTSKNSMNPNLARFFPSIPHLSARIYAKSDVEDSDHDLGMGYFSIGMMFPVWRPNKDGMEGLYIGGDASLLTLDSDVKLPETGVNLPDELYDLNLSIAYFHKLDNGWQVGGFIRGGSPSDKPFNSWEEVSARGAAFLRMPRGPNTAWLAYVGFDTISDFPYPVPGFGYEFKTKKIRGLVGLPFNSITAEPVENLKIDFSYIPLRTVNAKIAYGPKDLLQGYVSFDWVNKRYLTVDRHDEDDRLFVYEKSVRAGIEVLKWKLVSIDAYGGYAFDREIFEGDEYDDRDHHAIKVEDGAFGGLAVRVRF